MADERVPGQPPPEGPPAGERPETTAQGPARHPPPGPAPYGTPYVLVPQWPAEPRGKENALAIVGLVCSIAGTGLLIVSFGFLWFLSLPLSIAGLVCGVLGRQKVDRGELHTGRGLGQAGFIVGIVGVALHVLALVVFVVLFGLLFGSLDELQVPERGRPSGLDRTALEAAGALVIALRRA